MPGLLCIAGAFLAGLVLGGLAVAKAFQIMHHNSLPRKDIP